MYRKTYKTLAWLLLFTLISHATGEAQSVGVTADNDHSVYYNSLDDGKGHIIFNENNFQQKTNPLKSTIFDVPANDNCADAEQLSGEVAGVYFTTFEATSDGPHDYVTGDNVWFLYNATFTGLTQIVVADTGAGVKTNYVNVAIYDGSEITCFHNLVSWIYGKLINMEDAI